MPKKTTYSRSSAQRNKARQKSFEVVRPGSSQSVLETAESGDETEDLTATDLSLEETEQSEEKAEPEVVEVSAPRSRRVRATSSREVKEIPSKEEEEESSLAVAAAVASPEVPKSASARLAARRKEGQKRTRLATQLISAENYGYVRKDLIYILVLAIVLFAAIVVMHFVPAIGG